MKRTKEIIVCIIALIMLAFAVNEVYADTTNLDDLNDLISGNNNSATNTNTGFDNIATVNNTAAINNVAAVDNNATNTTVPKTGLDNSSIIFIIGICGVSAIYAYKKIKDYNIK